jgi:hypothetical protein
MLQKEWQMLLSFQSSCKCKIGRYTLGKTVGGDLQEFGIFLSSLSFSLWISSELSFSLEMGGCGIEGVTARICIC